MKSTITRFAKGIHDCRQDRRFSVGNVPWWGMSLLLLVLALPLAAGEARQLDVRVLIDVSGSMKKNDPGNLRQPALRLLAGLLPMGSQAGVWIFDRAASVIAPLALVDEDWRQAAIQGARQIHSSGAFTHIEGALRIAAGDWYQAAPAVDRHLILLTDGMVDVSHDPEDSKASRRRIVNEVLGELKTAGARVHTIALSPRSDRELLHLLSEATGGLHEAIDEADRLQRVFLRLFEQAGKPDSLPLRDNRFQVDAGIQEATIVLFRAKNAAPPRLIAPDNASHSLEKRPDSIAWHQDQGYELITIHQPQPGEWRLQAAIDPDNRVMVVTDLKMQLDDLPALVLAEERVDLKAHFSNQGSPMKDREFIDLVRVRAQLTDPAGQPQAFDLRLDHASGVFDHRLSLPAASGRYELVVTGRSETFIRERRHLFEVREAVTLNLDATNPELFKLGVQLDPELVREPELSALLLTAEGELPQVVAPVQENRFEVEVSPLRFTGEARLQLTLVGKFRDQTVTIKPKPLVLQGAKVIAEPEPVPKQAAESTPEAKPEPAKLEPEPEPVKEEPRPEPVQEPPGEEGPSLTSWGWFGGLNLLLLLMLGGGWWYWSRSKAAALTADLNEGSKDGEEEG